MYTHAVIVSNRPTPGEFKVIDTYESIDKATDMLADFSDADEAKVYAIDQIIKADFVASMKYLDPHGASTLDTRGR